MKYRSFACTVCDHEVEDLLDDEDVQHVIGAPCTQESCTGTFQLIPGGCKIAGSVRTNIKTSGWFRERSQEMKRKMPHSRIGTGAASI